MDLKRALELFAQPKKMRGRSAPLKELGVFPDTQETVQVHTGKYGPYIKVGAKNISLAEDMKIEDLTLEAVLPLIRDKIGSAGGAKKASKKVPRTILKKSLRAAKVAKATPA